MYAWAMEQEIRFCELNGHRIAYATVGEGPPLVFGGRWISHLEEEWADPLARSFFEELAESHRVVRYDRLGVGLSDRIRIAAPRLDVDAQQLGTVIDACGGAQVTVFACSCSGLATARFASDAPDRVARVVFFGAYAARDDIPAATRRSVVDLTRVNWPLASQMIAGRARPPRERGRDCRAQPPPEAVRGGGRRRRLPRARPHGRRPFLPPAGHGPALVLHRRSDRTVPIGRGRELASLLPNARPRGIRQAPGAPLAGRPATEVGVAAEVTNRAFGSSEASSLPRPIGTVRSERRWSTSAGAVTRGRKERARP